eukprot:4830023-Pleurochrysis_carterae.AAC.1
MAKLGETVWTPENAVGIMIDGGLSFRQMDMLRNELLLTYHADCDRYCHPVFVQLGNHFVRRPEPIPPRY